MSDREKTAARQRTPGLGTKILSETKYFKNGHLFIERVTINLDVATTCTIGVSNE